MLVYGLIRLRKGHLGGDVTEWYQAERLAGVRPEVVVLVVADRVGGVIKQLGRGWVVPTDSTSCQGTKAMVGVNKVKILVKIIKIHK